MSSSNDINTPELFHEIGTIHPISNMKLYLLDFLVSLGLLTYWFYKNIKKYGIIWIAKGLLQIGILILFIGGFLKIFITLPPNLYIKILFFITYIWCTVGINVNFMIPLINFIDHKFCLLYTSPSPRDRG